MALAKLSDADRIRLAVAIAVLRSKPKQVSVSSYILDLHPKFPPSGPTPPTADHCWRTYALALERDLTQLKAKYDVQSLELLASNSDPAPEIPPSIDSSDPHASPVVYPAKLSKKKGRTKKAPGSNDVKMAPKQNPCIDPSSVFQDLHNQINIQIPRNGELLLALRAFGKAVSNDNRDEPTLFYATLHTLRVTSRMLESAIDNPTAQTANHTTFSVLGRVLHHTLASSLPSISIRPESATEMVPELSDVDKVFDFLIENIFGPIIRAFRRMTQSFLSSLLPEPPHPNCGPASPENYPLNPDPIDLRPDLFGLFQILVSSLDSATLSVRRRRKQDHSLNSRWAISLSSVRASLVLQVIRELRRILFPTLYEMASEGNGSGAEPANGAQTDGTCVESRVRDLTVPDPASISARMERLVAKDALWYLCSLMHILADLPKPEGFKLPSGTTPGASPLNIYTPSEPDLTKHGNGTVLLELLHDAILSALYDLVLKCQSAVDQLEKDHGRSLGKCSRTEPVDNKHHIVGDVNKIKDYDSTATSDPQPIRIKHNVSAGGFSAHGAGESMWNSQAQGQPSVIVDSEAEVGDPGGRDDNRFVLAGGAHCDTDIRTYSEFNQGGIDEDTNTSNQLLSSGQPELGVYSSDGAGSATESLIDEVGFTMLLGVVERYILDPEYMI